MMVETKYMSYTKGQAKIKVTELVERFRDNIDVYKRSTYNETQVRHEFVDPFFEVLGWDVNNAQGYAEQYKEVIHEDTIKVGHSTRAPDYSFRIGGQRKFFVEAKKPAVNIKADVSPSYQLRRYAWSAKLPLSILTDFEELSVFDCRVKPKPTDKPDIARIKYITFDEYLDRFDEIYDVFSKEAILKGSFDRYAESTKGKKGTAEVDTEFLKEIESWRELLAKNIALRNPDVTIYELNYAVQKIIDRIIFLRICEDRGIEPYGQLQTKAESGEVYKHLLNHFKLAESKYDSGIFDFDADRITPALQIDDKVLKTIIQHLYYPESPYEFSVLGVEILGNVYEQFLGKVIRLTAGHQAKVETKPEVKKAGGVYYTPQYIVEYIVKNTVGKLIEGKTPDEIAELKILDPACGSGSFLIGAYTYLLTYHLDWYTRNLSFKKKALPKKYKAAVFQVKENEWYLTTAEKKRILLNNIFGVDIDQQAVEVTKLSLQLKLLEHESRESIDQQVKLGLEGALPNLDDTIKCGNSLIGPDFYDAQQQATLFDEAEMRRINVFDWNDDVKGFGRIMKRGGFDCVIGNPPYVRQEMLGVQKKYFETHYEAFVPTADLYVNFVEKALTLTKPSGRFGFIVSNKWMRARYGGKLRRLVKRFEIEKLVDFGELNVFQKAATFPLIVIITKKEPGTKPWYAPIKCLDFLDLSEEVRTIGYELENGALADEGFRLITEDALRIFDKMKAIGVPLGEYCRNTIRRGILTGFNKAFVIDRETRDDLIAKDARSAEIIKPFIIGDDVRNYQINFRERYLILTKMGIPIMQYSAIFEYLKQYQKQLEKRWDKGDHWWELRACNYYDEFKKPKIVWPEIAKESRFAWDDGSYYYNKTCFILPSEEFYLLGILNSKLIWSFLLRTCSVLGDPDKRGRLTQQAVYVTQIPIKKIDLSNPTEKAQHDKLVSLVESMLELKKKHHDAKMERDKELYERQMKIVDAQIDRLVYALYGLTDEEIEVVEQSP
ncbi:MAG TPA: N-6 DNA methylase [Desulfobacteria bacterium]|nr:N-6 DNA methylase [Desulfobacteria bacterium]